MTSKEYLNQAYRIDQRIKSKMDQAASLRDMLTRTNQVMSDMPGNPNKDRSKLEETMVKIVDMENEINSDIGRLMDLKQEIMAAVKAVDDVQCQMLLELRYLCFHTWEDIAAELNCTVRNVHILHSKALGLVHVPG